MKPYIMFATHEFHAVVRLLKSRLFNSTFPRPLISISSILLEVGPLNPARGSGERCKLLDGVWGGAPAEIEFGAFKP